MGTSKGYIAPTTTHWTDAKRAVTGFVAERDAGKRKKAAGQFSVALQQDIELSAPFVSAVSELFRFLDDATESGLDHALRDINRNDLLNKSSDEIFEELISEFTNSGSTIEDSLAADAISGALKNLEIDEVSDLESIPSEELLIEILCEYIKYSFSFRFSERISKNRTPAETAEIITDMWGYISNTIHEGFDKKPLQYVDFKHLGESDFVKNALIDALKMFEDFYEED